jgi:hypothetical protein
MKIIREKCGEAFGEENRGEERATVVAMLCMLYGFRQWKMF